MKKFMFMSIKYILCSKCFAIVESKRKTKWVMLTRQIFQNECK